MRYVTYEREGGLRHGVLSGDLDAGDARVRELGAGDLAALVADPSAAAPAPGSDGETFRLADVALRAPLLRPGKLLGVAANYQEHVREAGATDLEKSRISPRLFLMPPTAIAHPGGEVALPRLTRQMDWEAELCVVIGERCRDVPKDRALATVFGYMAGNDLSARSLDLGYERDTSDAHVGFFDWLAGKWPDGFAPLGPMLVTADEIPDPQDLAISLTLNGRTRQDASTAAMIFSIAELIAFASSLMTLEPGDVIMTGTPSGVGAADGTFLRPGDALAVTIEKLGTLTTKVVSP